MKGRGACRHACMQTHEERQGHSLRVPSEADPLLRGCATAMTDRRASREKKHGGGANRVDGNERRIISARPSLSFSLSSNSLFSSTIPSTHPLLFPPPSITPSTLSTHPSSPLINSPQNDHELVRRHCSPPQMLPHHDLLLFCHHSTLTRSIFFCRAGFKKNLNRATTSVLTKTGSVERTADREFEEEEKRFKK